MGKCEGVGAVSAGGIDAGGGGGGCNGHNRDFNKATWRPLSQAPRFTKNSSVSKEDPSPSINAIP